ncbi:MAG: NUDIX domain-containing protein [Candidatus Kapaibacterium sp.]
MVQVHIARPSARHGWELLVLRRSPEVKRYPGIVQCVTGRVEKDETAVACALRETREETSLTPSRMWILPHVATWYSLPSDSVESSPCFGIVVEAGANVHISTEHDSFEWVSSDDAVERFLIPSQRLCAELFLRRLASGLDDEQWNMVYEIDLR